MGRDGSDFDLVHDVTFKSHYWKLRLKGIGTFKKGYVSLNPTIGS